MWYKTTFPKVINYTLYYVGVLRCGPTWAAAFGYLVSSITVGLNHVFLNAALTILIITGTSLVVLRRVLGNGEVEKMVRIKRIS